MATVPCSDAVPPASADAWPHWTVLSTYGVRVGVRASDPVVLSRLCERLPPGGERLDLAELETATVDFLYSVRSSQPSGSVGSQEGDGAVYYEGFTGETLVFLTTDEASALDAFESAVRFDVAVATSEWVFVHAGVVGWRGGAVVIPAPSRHGKSTLVAALVAAGATYYSDEFAVIDARGLVHPFPIPMALRNTTGGTDRVPVAGAGNTPPLPVRCVLATRYEAGAGWQPRRGTGGDALLALFANTVRARVAPQATLAVLARAVAGAGLIEGVRGEAGDVAPLLLENAGRRSGTEVR